MLKCVSIESHSQLFLNFSAQSVMCGVLLSMFGKLLVLPALLWGHEYSALYTPLLGVFTVAANIQALRGKNNVGITTQLLSTIAGIENN